ncbi:DEAD/DEAH box helicase [Corynebacterium auris]|uniref:DEAD/DEAH box helicase n=1 Tax=Corynebacterium auris TaxID=44750 RepID=UPI0025B52290|nr:DEAD/DEAH box helicase [Corynebacterium auris]WJY67799.1 ATP-dependent helicase HepA [Corynebacterium auris]
MPKFLLHGLWLAESGLNLWVEQVEGHRIVLPSQVPRGTFPPAVEALLDDATFHHRARVRLQTPRGRHVELKVPTAAYAPEEAVSLLAALSFLDARSPAASAAQREAIAPDVYWLVRAFTGVSQFVRAGRVSIHVPYRDGLWYAEWQLGTGVEERGWLAEMIAAAPGVLTVNNPNLGENIAQTLVHWVATAHLREVQEEPRPYPWHDFVHSLLTAEPLRRGGGQLSLKVSEWNGSITAVNLQLVFIVEQPDDGVEGPAQWPVRVQVRAGSDAPRPIRLADYDAQTAQTLRRDFQRAAEAVELLDPAGHPRQPWTPLSDHEGEWDIFLNNEEIVRFVTVDSVLLRARNFAVMLPRAWSEAETTAKLHVSREDNIHDSSTTTAFGFDTLVNYDWRLSVGGVDLTDEEMRSLISSKSGLVKLRGEWVLADRATLAKTKRYMSALSGNNDNDGDEGATSGTATAAELRELALETLDEAPVEFTGSPWFTSLVGGTDRPAPERVDIPDTVRAQLREYQRRGVDWLYFMSRNNLGAVLADDMGLGKTLQLLSLLAVEHAEGRAQGPTLVVAPTSVVGNWAREAQRFVPGLRVAVHHGSNRLKGEQLKEKIAATDVFITSYGVASRDVEELSETTWDHVVLDEAQAIKNAGTRASKSVRALPARHRIALTGTPIENKLSELRNILDFVNPGMLGSQQFFRNHFARVIETRRDEALADDMSERLRRLTSPFILRRLKTDPAIIDDLPDKQETVLTVDMTAEQAALYTALVDDMKAELEKREGMARKGLVLASITRIKQICNHPAHYLGDGSAVTAKGRHRSGKVEALMQLLGEAVESDQRVLIFTQYKAFGDILQPYVSARLGEIVPFLHGGVGKTARDTMVERFQAPDGPRAMILSLKAGGTGLNLTAASVVIHMDRWWNPAVENQATDRAFRIGQQKNVSVYKMITKGTLEESIQDVLDGKMHLAGAVVGEGEGWITELDTEDLTRLMSYRGQG